ncbi:MAG: pentapeptide repeat-containing protein, partial [Bdellovibrio sp.]|nr:pentapeptide repeat-containing protein [Methylotenera sp.]
MKFIDSVNFKNVVFEWDARFDRTTFNHVIFNNAIFYTIAGFSEAI